jgi:hypothetical protein
VVLEQHMERALFPPHQVAQVAVAVVKLLLLPALLLVQRVKVALAVLETKAGVMVGAEAAHLR